MALIYLPTGTLTDLGAIRSRSRSRGL